MKTIRIVATAFLLALFISPALFAQEDLEGGKDHPLFNRMPGYFISDYNRKDFDSFEFEGKNGKPVAAEGRYTHILYRTMDGKTPASPLQIGRNYQNAATKIGGAVLYQELASGGGLTTMKLAQGSKEIWIKISIGDSGNNYKVDIIEKAGMEQTVTANADVWKSDINSTGHAAIYGIYFDTDQAAIKAGSEAALKEIAALLKKNPTLNVRLVGHTDSTGDFAHNMTLSDARAKAVMSALTGQYGVAAARLSGHGVGPLAPVASNDTEEGRAKNRRVELVKR
jgi:outer membrane protein OmpA-like peptidoglycan-associated protein